MPVRPLTPELAEVAREELGETLKKLEDGIAHLKEWISKQPHLKARTDDQWLAAFIRGCKFSIEKAKEKIDLYYALRSTAADLYSLKYSDPKFLEIINLGSTVVLPKTATPSGPRVLISRPGLCDPNKYSLSEALSVTYFIQQMMQLEDDNVIVSGVIYITDLQGVTLSHLTQITPIIIKKMIASGQDAAPVRMKGGHYLNLPSAFETLFNFGKSLLNEKNRNRIHIHKNLESLHNHVPKQILPIEYGGSDGTITENIERWKQKYAEYSSWLEEDLQYKTDESKRPGKPKTAEDMFGVDGSFRQLEFD